MINNLTDKVLKGEMINPIDTPNFSIEDSSTAFDLFYGANKIRQYFRGNFIDLCSIVNAKSGGCAEDCSYCSQSSISKAEIEHFPLKNSDIILKSALDAMKNGAKRFCVVTGGRKPAEKDIGIIAEIIPEIKKIGLKPCATLGLLNKSELKKLKDAGLDRFHHNLETSERFFPNVCTTHTYQDKINTILAAKEVGLSICSGGIFGLGETWQDRFDMAFALREQDVDCVPINYLTPIIGTRLGDRPTLDPIVALKVISMLRYILPAKEIRVCGGRMQTLGDFNSNIFMAGADGLLIGNYLTTTGRPPELDIKFIKQSGFTY